MEKTKTNKDKLVKICSTGAGIGHRYCGEPNHEIKSIGLPFLVNNLGFRRLRREGGDEVIKSLEKNEEIIPPREGPFNIYREANAYTIGAIVSAGASYHKEYMAIQLYKISEEEYGRQKTIFRKR